MLNRKFADLRHSRRLDPCVLSYDAAALPQAVVAIGPRAQRKTKGGVVLAESGFTRPRFLFPVDICRPLEETDGMLSFLDLKLDRDPGSGLALRHRAPAAAGRPR